MSETISAIGETRRVQLSDRRDGSRYSPLGSDSCHIHSEHFPEMAHMDRCGLECKIVDISVTGFGLLSSHDLPVGDEVKLDLLINERVFKDLDAFVAYSHAEEDHYRLGVVVNFRSKHMLEKDIYNSLNKLLHGDAKEP